MSENFEKLRDIYKNIYSITLRISLDIEKSNLEEIENSLKERGILIDKISKIARDTLSESEKAEINCLKQSIISFEEDNINKLEIRKNEVGKEIAATTINHKAISAYKIKKQINPRIFDTTE